jgi:hypothetical protein
MSSRTIKKLLLSLIVVGILASFTAKGTFAVLNGEGTNPANSIASGTLTLTETLTPATGSDTPCTTQSGSVNVNTGCFTILSDTTKMYPIPSAAQPPLPASTTYQSAHISVQNTGSLALTLKLYMPSCTYATTSGAPTFSWSAINPCCPGTTSGTLPSAPCSAGSLDFFIQETNAPTGSPRTWTTLSSCVWPASTSAACTLSDDSLGGFWAGHHDNTHYLSLGTIAAGATRYFQIALAEPSDAANGLQGQTPTFALYWHAEQ